MSKVKYPEVKIQLAREEKALSAEKAKKLLGWIEEPEGEEWGSEFLARDSRGKKVRCINNTINVPFKRARMMLACQEILTFKEDGNRCWKFNGEPVIIGKTGQVLNGQHALFALVYACQLVEDSPEEYPKWEEPPTIDKLIVFGIEEDDDTANTMDLCAPRRQADVFFRSDLFDDIEHKGEKKKVAKLCSHAVNLLWERLGVEHAFSVSRQTHSLAVEFIRRHPRLVEAALHVYREDVDGSISNVLSPGYSAALLYLMGTSATDHDRYVDNPCEESVDWGNWERAISFFSDMGSKEKGFKVFRQSFGTLMKREGGHVTRKERIVFILKGWQQYAKGGIKKSIRLSYVERDGVSCLKDNPTLGGIDCGQS